uniref:Putative secreted protein n=1 Tax=Anopheles darlingi TaxID=43151 RepID=A0A2M4DDY4_ANODA
MLTWTIKVLFSVLWFNQCRSRTDLAPPDDPVLTRGGERAEDRNRNGTFQHTPIRQCDAHSFRHAQYLANLTG